MSKFFINNSKSHLFVFSGSAKFININFYFILNFIFKEFNINLNSLTGTVVSYVILTSADKSASHMEIPLSFKFPLIFAIKYYSSSDYFSLNFF